MLITIQPQDDTFCTVKTKRKFIRKRDATMYWYECSKCGYTFAKGYGLDERRVLNGLPVKCPRCGRTVIYWS